MKSVDARCRAHRTGARLGSPPWFNEECPGCREKLAAGKVTGKEPRYDVAVGASMRNWQKGAIKAACDRRIARG